MSRNEGYWWSMHSPLRAGRAGATRRSRRHQHRPRDRAVERRFLARILLALRVFSPYPTPIGTPSARRAISSGTLARDLAECIPFAFEIVGTIAVANSSGDRGPAVAHSTTALTIPAFVWA